MAPLEGSRRRTGLAGFLAAATLLALGARQILRAPAEVGAKSFVGGTMPSCGACTREAKVACRGVDKKLKDRIASVKKTGKMTEAMQMIAAARVRKAQKGVDKSRPFSAELQGMIKGLVNKLKGSGLEQELPMLRVPEKVTTVGLVLITGNRGLCGAYNSFVGKMAKARILELQEQGITAKIVSVGKKAARFGNTKLMGVEYNDTGIFLEMPDDITAKAAAELGEEVKNLFLSGEVDKVEFIYTKFVNLLSFKPTIRTVLPLAPVGAESEEDETFKLTSEDGKLSAEKVKVPAAKAKKIENDVIFDQPPTTILNSMLPLYLNSQIISMLFESQASELGSRMNAMKAATDNSADLAKQLTLLMNKKRQAGITQEVCEVCAACLALEDGGTDDGFIGDFDTSEEIEGGILKEIEDGSVPIYPDLPEDIFDKSPGLADPEAQMDLEWQEMGR